MIINQLNSLILTLHQNPNLPRNVVDVEFNFLHEFIKKMFILSLKEDVINILRCENLSNETLINLETVLYEHQILFDNANSETKIFNLLKKIGFREPRIIKISNTLESVVIDNLFLQFTSIEALWMPLRETLKDFLELPGFLKEILDYMKSLYNNESGIITNIIQGK